MNTAAWPYGRGEMAERIRTFDWASTPLGSILSWPQSLKTAVEVMLASGLPAAMQWGPEAILLYNDANAHILGALHPAALGRPVFDALPARRASWEPVLHRVMTGESVVFAEQRLFINEDGVERKIWVDRAASPIRDETGAVVGLWEVFINITAYAERKRGATCVPPKAQRCVARADRTPRNPGKRMQDGGRASRREPLQLRGNLWPGGSLEECVGPRCTPSRALRACGVRPCPGCGISRRSGDCCRG